jgi:hypothetical protein
MNQGERIMNIRISGKVILIVGLFSHLILGSSVSLATSLAVTDVPGASTFFEGNPDGSSTRGWGFTVNSTIQVDSLSVWDEGGDGLSLSHPVAIWTGSGELVASTIIQAGTLSDAIGPAVEGGLFRVESITPVSLTAGTSYVIGAQYFVSGSSDGVLACDFVFCDTVVTNSAISYDYIAGRRIHFGSFDFPEFTVGGIGYFGPNFTIVPVPATVWLFGSGLLGLIGIARRKKTA